MKQKFIVLFSALLIALVLSPVYSASAYGTLSPIVVGDDGVITSFGNYGDYFANPGVGGNYYFQVDEFLDYLMYSNIPFVSTSVTGIWDESMVDKGGLSGSRYSITIPYDTNAIFSIDDNDVITMSTTKTRNTLQITVDTNKYIQTNQQVNTAVDNCPPFSNPKIYNVGLMPIRTVNTLRYYNPNGGSLGENAMVLPTSNADKSLLEMDVNTMRIVKPVSNASIDTENNTIFADRDYFDFELQVKIAIPDDITLDSHTRSPLWGTRDLGEFVKRNKNAFLGQSLAVEFPNALFADVKSVEVLGTNRDWVNNHCVIYIVKGQVALDSNHSDLNDVKLTIGCNIITDFYSVVSADYLWINDTVTMNLSYHKDLDGDGIDDETGEVIPTDSLVDTDGDGVPDDGKITGDSFFEKFTDDMKKVPKYSDDVGDLYSQIFGMFPPPIPQLITLGICLIIFVSVLGFIRG